MKVSYPRLKAVRLKEGASVSVIHGGAPEMISEFQQSSEETIDTIPDMAGFAIVAWDFKGRAVRSWSIHKRSPVQRSLMPSYIRDILLKEITELQTMENLEEI